MPIYLNILNLILLLSPSMAWAIKYHGRWTEGGFVSTENYKNTETTQKDNDFAIISSRLYLDIADISNKKIGMVADLRDKQDFFDKLDKEKMELSESNKFQLREFYLSYPNFKGSFFSKAGRFYEPSGGASFVDGVEVGGRHLISNIDFGTFAGLNPKKEGVSYVETDTDSTTAGLFSLYQSGQGNLSKYVYSNNAIVTNQNKEQSDRTYYFNSTTYQWKARRRISLLMYWDFEPENRLQNINTSYMHSFTNRMSATLGYSRIDLIEYHRQQSVLDSMPSSAYEKESLGMKYNWNRNNISEIEFSYGQRKLDDKTRAEVFFYHYWPFLIGENLSLGGKIGARKNFVSDDLYTSWNLGHTTDHLELDFSTEFTQANYHAGGTKNPILNELSLGYISGKEFFTSLAVQYAKDENVDIMSSSLRFTYRFGNREIPKLRDGSPPRGRL